MEKVVWRITLLLPLTWALAAQSPELVAKSRQASEHMAAGRFEAAIPLYEELVRAIPGNAGLLLNLGMARHMAGRDREAVGPLEAALKIQPEMPPAWYLLGASHLGLGEAAKAAPYLRKAVQAMPDNPNVRRRLADALRALGSWREAAVEFQALTELQPDSPAAWLGLGESYEALAGSAFEDLAKLAPESGHLFALLGEARAKEKQYAAAFYFYRQALAKQSELPGLHSALAEIYRATGHPDWAAVEQERAKRLPPLDCSRDKLACEFRDGRYREIVAATDGLKTAGALYWRIRACNEMAGRAFQRLARLPPSVEFYEFLARMHRIQRRPLDAAEQWRAALKLAPNDRRLETQLAVCLHMGRDYEAARPLLEKLLRSEPDSAELNYLLGDVLLNQGELERSVTLLTRAVERNPELLPAHVSLAQAYAQSGRPEAAIPHLKAALPADEDGSLHFQLARALRDAGQAEAAKEFLIKYQQIQKNRQAERRQVAEEFQIVAP